jgi:hypothetical protein
MVDQSEYPVLFGTTQASWAPIDLRFELLTGEPDPARIARVYAVQVLAPEAAVSLLAAKGRAWKADLYRLAANRRAADLTPS